MSIINYPRLLAYLKSGDIVINGGDYIGHAADDTWVYLGDMDGEDELESMLTDLGPKEW